MTTDRETSKDAYELERIKNIRSSIGEHTRAMNHAIMSIQELENHVKHCKKSIAELEDQLKEYEG